MTKIHQLEQSKFIRIKGKLYDLSQPKIMGILNLTPDSFFEESRKTTLKAALQAAEKMIKEGAEILDIGAISTRPNAEIPDEDEEWKRLKEILIELRIIFPNIVISVDTFRSRIAEKAILSGADIINDISGGQFEPEILTVVAANKTPYVLAHSLGKGKNSIPNSENSLIMGELIRFLSEKINLLQQLGHNDIIIDPGFGFDKTIDDNYEIVRNFEMLHILERPLLVGISRKSMIWKKLAISMEDSLNGTSILHTLLYTKKCNVFRVHDVTEMKQIRELLQLSI